MQQVQQPFRWNHLSIYPWNTNKLRECIEALSSNECIDFHWVQTWHPISSGPWSLILRCLLMPGVNAVPTPDTIRMYLKRGIQIWSGSSSLSQTFSLTKAYVWKLSVILASCYSWVRFDWQPLTLATFRKLCKDTGGQSRLSHSASGWGHDTVEPVDPLEVIISASSYETEAKGGHAVPAWSQSAQLVL